MTVLLPKPFANARVLQNIFATSASLGLVALLGCPLAGLTCVSSIDPPRAPLSKAKGQAPDGLEI